MLADPNLALRAHFFRAPFFLVGARAARTAEDALERKNALPIERPCCAACRFVSYQWRRWWEDHAADVSIVQSSARRAQDGLLQPTLAEEWTFEMSPEGAFTESEVRRARNAATRRRTCGDDIDTEMVQSRSGGGARGTPTSGGDPAAAVADTMWDSFRIRLLSKCLALACRSLRPLTMLIAGSTTWSKCCFQRLAVRPSTSPGPWELELGPLLHRTLENHQTDARGS